MMQISIVCEAFIALGPFRNDLSIFANACMQCTFIAIQLLPAGKSKFDERQLKDRPCDLQKASGRLLCRGAPVHQQCLDMQGPGAMAPGKS